MGDRGLETPLHGTPSHRPYHHHSFLWLLLSKLHEFIITKESYYFIPTWSIRTHKNSALITIKPR